MGDDCGHEEGGCVLRVLECKEFKLCVVEIIMQNHTLSWLP